MEKNYKIIPFVLSKAKTQDNPNGLDVVTKSGNDARIICTDKSGEYPIVVLINDGNASEAVRFYSLNGKISLNNDMYDLVLKEQVKTRRMTNQELSWWLRDCPEEHREWKWTWTSSGYVYNPFSYLEEEANEECSENILIRSNGGEWREPLIEIND